MSFLYICDMAGSDGRKMLLKTTEEDEEEVTVNLDVAVAAVF